MTEYLVTISSDGAPLQFTVEEGALAIILNAADINHKGFGRSVAMEFPYIALAMMEGGVKRLEARAHLWFEPRKIKTIVYAEAPDNGATVLNLVEGKDD
jgi:hypothetical protein